MPKCFDCQQEEGHSDDCLIQPFDRPQIVCVTIVASLDVAAGIAPFLAWDLHWAGLTLPDGRVVRPCLALEVMSADETEISYITSCAEMEALGFSNLDYQETEFGAEGPVEEENENADL